MGLNIVPFSEPVILKQLLQYNVSVNRNNLDKTPNRSHISHVISLFPSYLASKLEKNSSTGFKKNSELCRSKYISSQEFCSQLKFHNYSSHSRPWEYEIHIYLIIIPSKLKSLKGSIPAFWQSLDRQYDFQPLNPTIRTRILAYGNDVDDSETNRKHQFWLKQVFFELTILQIVYIINNPFSNITVFIPCLTCGIKLSIFGDLKLRGLQGVFEHLNKQNLIYDNSSIGRLTFHRFVRSANSINELLDEKIKINPKNHHACWLKNYF